MPKADQAIFDRLLGGAKLHVQAGVMVSHPWAFETIMTAVLLEHEKWIKRILKQLDGKEMR